MAAITQSIDMTVEQAKNLVIGVLRDEKTGSEDVENARFVRDMLEGLRMFFSVYSFIHFLVGFI